MSAEALGDVYFNVSFGQESTAIVEAWRRGWIRLPKGYESKRPILVMADPGAEMPYTLNWAHRFFLPHLRDLGLELHWLRPGSEYHRTGPSPGYPEGRLILDIRTMYMRDANPSFPMLTSGARCTETHKQNVLARFRAGRAMATYGLTPHERVRRGHRDVVLVGIAADETHRALPSPAKNYEILYPLIDLGMGRRECVQLITSSGLAVPGKSGCSMCPFAPAWSHWWLSQAAPREFQKNVQLEAVSVRDRLNRGLKPNYMLHQYDAPLPEAVQMWREKNPRVSLAEVERWFYDRDAYRVEWGRKKTAAGDALPCYNCTAA